jgi:hypothetical protein
LTRKLQKYEEKRRRVATMELAKYDRFPLEGGPVLGELAKTLTPISNLKVVI